MVSWVSCWVEVMKTSKPTDLKPRTLPLSPTTAIFLRICIPQPFRNFVRIYAGDLGSHDNTDCLRLVFLCNQVGKNRLNAKWNKAGFFQDADHEVVAQFFEIGKCALVLDSVVCTGECWSVWGGIEHLKEIVKAL